MRENPYSEVSVTRMSQRMERINSNSALHGEVDRIGKRKNGTGISILVLVRCSWIIESGSFCVASLYSSVFILPLRFAAFIYLELVFILFTLMEFLMTDFFVLVNAVHCTEDPDRFVSGNE